MVAGGKRKLHDEEGHTDAASATKSGKHAFMSRFYYQCSQTHIKVLQVLSSSQSKRKHLADYQESGRDQIERLSPQDLVEPFLEPSPPTLAD
jgi:hypothetical protein